MDSLSPPKSHTDPPPQDPPLPDSLEKSSNPPYFVHPQHKSSVINIDVRQSHNSVSDLHQTGEMLGHISLREQKGKDVQDSKLQPDQYMEDLGQSQDVVEDAQRLVRYADSCKQREHDDGDKRVNSIRSPNYANQIEELDLAAIMRSLKIAIPEEVEIGYQGEEIQKSEENSPFQLLLKVGCSSGTPRNIPLQPLNQAMSKAWGKNYWVIDQVKQAVYKAYFKDDDAMDFVMQKQPWSLDGDNLLLEWVNPKNPSKSVDEYNFHTIYVPIRVYGVPEKYRVPSMMRYVIDKVAQPSDIHPPPEIRMTIKQDYVQAYAKMDITIPVKDKVKYYVGPDEYIFFYLNYDKVKRICTFCGLMFHTVQFCPNRRKLIQHLISIGANTSSVPFSYVGIWTSQASKIPQIALDQSKILGGLSPEFRRYMNIDKSVESTPMTLSRFTLSDTNARQEYIQRRESEAPKVSNQNKGNFFASLSRPNEAHPQQVGLLGPPPVYDPKINPRQQCDTSSYHTVPQPYPSTQAICKSQQPSGSTTSLHRSKRQATSDLVCEDEHDAFNRMSPLRFKSVPPSSPQYSGTASSYPHSSDKLIPYKSPQVRYGYDTASVVDIEVHAQANPNSPPIEEAPNRFAPGTSEERRIIRPRKHRSRWDQKGVGSKHDETSAPRISTDVLQNNIVGAFQQAQQIASHIINSDNYNPSLVHNMHDQVLSSPACLQSTYDKDQYKTWLEHAAVAELGPSSQDDQHGGLLHSHFANQTRLAIDAGDNIVPAGNEDVLATTDIIGQHNMEGVEENQAAAPASKAPQEQ